MPSSRFVIVTAISGTGRYHLRTTAKSALPNWHILDFEQSFFAAELLKSHRSIRPRPDLPEEILPEIAYDLGPLLALPEPVIRDAWRAAFAVAAEEIHSALQTQSVLLFMHASILSPESTSAFSVCDPAQLVRSGLQANCVVNLIDDVFDCLLRLTRPHKLFWNLGYRDAVDEVAYLLQLLDWREVEFRASEVIASCLGSPETILFALKHPWRTLEKILLGSGEQRIYLSHPITSIRQFRGPIDENRLFQNIDGIASWLRDRCILFEPTMIDELRMEPASDDHPRLSTRWPVPRDRDGVPERQCLASLKDAPPLFLESGAKSASGALETLRTRIDLQVNWRDRQLVEQANTLVVVRPFAVSEPLISGGVGEEMMLHQTMSRLYPESRTPGMVLHPPEDEVGRRLRLLQFVIAERYSRHGAQFEWRDEEIVQAASALMEHWKANMQPADIDLVVQRAIPGARIGEDTARYHNLGRHRRIDYPVRARADFANLVEQVLFREHEDLAKMYPFSSYGFLSGGGTFIVWDGGELYSRGRYSGIVNELMDRITSSTDAPHYAGTPAQPGQDYSST